MRNLFIGIFLGLAFLISCQNKRMNHGDKTDTSERLVQEPVVLRPHNLKAHKVIRMRNGDLDVVFVDNSPYGDEHRAGYNGIAEMSHKAQDSSIFVPFYAGFNLEHIFGGDSLVELFEPRKHPMELYKISDTEVVLYQSTTPLSHVESQTIFELKSPHYVDINFRFIIHDPKFFKHGYAGFFWASYIHAPHDKRINFIGYREGMDTSEWLSAYSSVHGSKSTHIWKDEESKIYFAPNFNATLASHFSDYVYDQTFYYGRFHNMVLAYMFHPVKGIRFSQSPNGGGEDNPAWDFQLIIPDFEVGCEYSLHVRMMYKEYEGANDVLRAYQIWKNAIESK